MAEFTLLLLTGDRPSQVVACLTSLLFQVPSGTHLELYDNGKIPVLESGMVRGLLDLACRLRGWQFTYQVQERDTVGVMKEQAVIELPSRDGLLLWTDDDCVWGPQAVSELLKHLGEFAAVSPVVVDLLDMGYPNFTGFRRLDSPKGKVQPEHHLYGSQAVPIEVEMFGGIFMCSLSALKDIGWSRMPMIHDNVATHTLPGPKAVIPSAEVFHLPHTRPDSPWLGMSLPTMLRKGMIQVVGEPTAEDCRSVLRERG